MENLDKFLEEIQHLKDAKKLLEEILTGYDIYTGEFHFDNTGKLPTEKLINDLGHKKSTELPHLWKTKHEELNDKIRNYIEFDDSE